MGPLRGIKMLLREMDQLKKAEGALMLAAIKGKRDATALLTPEQREKERAHREKMKSGGEGQHGGGMGSGGHGGARAAITPAGSRAGNNTNIECAHSIGL